MGQTAAEPALLLIIATTRTASYGQKFLAAGGDYVRMDTHNPGTGS